MNHLRKTLILFILSSFLLVGCDDLLKVDSDKLIFENEYQLKSPNDSIYSLVGVLEKLQNLADSYVLFGELRGDLMDVTDKSDYYLQEINNFQISANNPYLKGVKDYYAIINNCNYIIQYTDTAKVKKVRNYYAAAKAIRAWTYMQLALNYGSAIYYDKPILTIEDAAKNYPELDFNNLATELIKDLQPWQHEEATSFSSAEFPIQFVLGDLYLWTGQYENAATTYHDLIDRNKYTLSIAFQSQREVENNAFTGKITDKWGKLFETSNDMITRIFAYNQYNYNFKLDSLNWKGMIKASSVAMNNWKSQRYILNGKVSTLGDLRMYDSYSPVLFATSSGYFIKTDSIIGKILSQNQTSTKRITPYRISLLYLRYAEAVNRLGKPNLAMAVLKNGLNSATLANKKIIPEWENPNPTPKYMDFKNIQFAGNFGIRQYGLGKVDQDSSFVIPASAATLNDSIKDVEDKIVNELALETALEGNRFHDLMRVALRRNDPSYLAKRVAAKHRNNKDFIEDKLNKTANWYLKK